MATKKYIAKTHISITVKMGEKNAHISFTPLTGSGSVYYTSDEAVQKALEQHHKYGKLFKEDMLYKEHKTVEVKPEPVKKPKTTEVRVSCLDDAKDYLSDRLGISRTKLRSEDSIMAAAAAKNIIFIGLDK